MSYRIPYFELSLSQEERDAVAAVIDDAWLTTGPRVAAFERAFAEALESPELTVLATTNCTASLHLALTALGIGPGDEVICPSLTFVADANAIRQAGATPVFADVCSETEWNIDPADIERKLSARTKAVIVVHYAGYPCRMDAVGAIARAHGLRVIEDACHGPLARHEGRMLGTIGDVGCFSFYSNKNMTTGEGGLLVSTDPAVGERARLMRSHGMSTSAYERFKGHAYGYDVTEVGFNYRMDELRAAIGLVQLAKLSAANRRRRALVERYRALMADRLADLTVPFREASGDYGYHIFPVLLPAGGPSRGEVMAAMAERGVQTSIHYRPIHSFSVYRHHDEPLPVTDAIGERILSLPLYPSLTEEQQAEVVDALRASLLGHYHLCG